MSSQVEEQIARLLATIREHRNTLDVESQRLRTPEIIDSFDKWNHDSWCLSVAGDCLIRLRLFTENNFNSAETMGTISVARYIFEVSVWLHLFKRDARYGLVYFSQLIDAQRRYWKDYREQLAREIALLRRFEREERDALTSAMSRIQGIGNPADQTQALLTAPNAIAARIDEQAARHFSVYAEQAKVNGYGFQAHLVEKKAVPQADASLAAIGSEQTAFDARIPQTIKDIIPNRWQWRQMAQAVGLTHEYDFIYTFSSRLLHATPASITTNQKNLEPQELALFLRYINVKITEIIELAREYPRNTAYRLQPSGGSGRS